MAHEIASRRVLYEIPGMDSVAVHEQEIAGVSTRTYGSTGPTVVIVAGFPDDRFAAHVGCRFMEMQWTVSMAQLLAISGFQAVTYSPRDPEADAKALLGRFEKAGIWTTSANSPVGLLAAAHATCAVFNNPMTKDFCPDTPIFVIRAGKDENPGLNDDLDAFVARALQQDKPLTLVNYPGVQHSYELYVDTPETHRILQQGFDFLKAFLG